MIGALTVVIGLSLAMVTLLLVNEVRYADRLRQAMNDAADAASHGDSSRALSILERSLGIHGDQLNEMGKQ